MNATEKDLPRLLLIGLLAAVTLLTALLLLLSYFSSGGMAPGLFDERPSPTPAPTGTPGQMAVSITPSPSPVAVKINRGYPEGAVDLLADGQVLFTLESREAALELLESYLFEASQSKLNANERLLKASFPQALSLGEPCGAGELLDEAEALALLMSDQALLPVNCTVISCAITATEVSLTEIENPAAPKGSRIIRFLGSPEFTLTYSETLYKGDTVNTQSVTNRFTVGSVAQGKIIEKGTYSRADVSGVPGANEGYKGRQSASLSLKAPVRGKILSYYGLRGETMQYGITYQAQAGAVVTAPEGGVVIYCGARGNMGYVIEIQHDEAGFVSRLLCSVQGQLELYQRVAKGETLLRLPDGAQGEALQVTWELLVDGVPLNPQFYMEK